MRKRRVDLGLTQREVAERIGVHEATIFGWEKNQHAPSAHSIPEIFSFLGQDPDDALSNLGQRIVGARGISL